MLLEFSIKNVLSFKEKFTFSLIAAPLKEKNERLKDNLFQINGKTKVLKTAAIYGANASGKTNVIKALQSFLMFITIQSKNITENEKINIFPFCLKSDYEAAPSEFEIYIKDVNTIYHYQLVLTQYEVIKESLKIKKQKSSTVFERHKDNISVNKKYEIISELNQKKMIAKNALVLTKAAIFNEAITIHFLDFLIRINTLSLAYEENYKKISIDLLKNQHSKNIITELLKLADSTINGIEVDSSDVYVSKNVYNEEKNIVQQIGLSIDSTESEGTKKLFYIAGPIIKALKYGFTIFVDELDTSIHPLLLKELIEIFHNPKQNPNNAQLVFTTHNTSLLNNNLFRRDQIWLVEKNHFGESQLYSLADFDKIKNDEKIEQNYLIGKYGAIPFFEDAKGFFPEEENDEE